MNPTATPPTSPPLTDHPNLIRMFAVACGVSVANLYYNQPLLSDIAREFHTTVAGVGVVPALTMIGYAVGMLFIVPLGDIVSRRRLIVTLLLLVTAAGWRTVYWMGSGLMVLLAAVLAVVLPAHEPPADHLPYADLLRSTWRLARTEPVLQRAMLNGALIFACFSAFWATLVFRLETPPLHYGTQLAGMFGLIGAAGALVAPLVGRRVDKTGPRVMITRATAACLASFVIFWLTGHTLIGLAAGVILLDLAVQAAQVTNMTRIYAINESAPSRVNSAFMVTYFVGGSAGALLATQAWKFGGWSGVCALSCAFAIIALVAHVLAHRQPATAPANTTPSQGASMGAMLTPPAESRSLADR